MLPLLSSTHLPFIRNYLEETLPSVKLSTPLPMLQRTLRITCSSTKSINKNSTGKLEILVSSNKKDFQDILRYIGHKGNHL